MLKSMLILFTMGVITMSAKAQDSDTAKYKEVQETKQSDIINVSADDLWELVGPGFADVHHWSRAVDHATVSGEPQFEGATCSERYCDINAKGFTSISEELIEYNESEKTLAYKAYAGLPGFVHYVQNRWVIMEVGPGQSRLQMTITVRMKPFMGSLMGGMFRKNLNTTIDGVMEDLKIYSETGNISEAKRQRITDLASA